MNQQQQHINQLSNSQTERLTLLIEECSEVIQASSKILRHGYLSYNPNDPNKITNLDKLETELGDLLLVIKHMTIENDISDDNLLDKSLIKSEKINPYLHYNNINESASELLKEKTIRHLLKISNQKAYVRLPGIDHPIKIEDLVVEVKNMSDIGLQYIKRFKSTLDTIDKLKQHQ